MFTAICLVLFVGLTIWEFSILFSGKKIWPLPYGDKKLMSLSNVEAFFIVLMATAYFGFMPVLALRLGILELTCVIALYMCKNKLNWSFPLSCYTLFLIWILIGICYSPSVSFGLRMLLKYLYPFIIALLASKVVKDGELFITSGIWSRRVATIGIGLHILPGFSLIISEILWFNAAFCTSIITMVIFSLALAEFSNEKRNNLIWGIALCIPCILLVYRTDIFGTAVAVATLFLVKYKLKALPLIGIIGLLGLLSMFYIPTVKHKMFINPENVTISDFISGNVEEDNVRNNMRKFMWENASKTFYEGHEWIGSGSGRVQKFFYTEAMDSRRGGQLHNDFLVILCDNGRIGLFLLIVVYFSALIHCMIIYTKNQNPYVRMAALTAGASMIGVAVTMYSDNTISYSMVTLSFPWAFYGMALGLKGNLD